ncbi:MAG: phage tail protein [Myxococcota bacterium]|nr:phage tail protein [Myxococcota bacterium]
MFTEFFPQQALLVNQPMVAHMFRVVIGADPFGAFTEVSNIAYEVPPYEINEGGRNFGPHLMPFNGPAKRGELTLKWGSVKRDKLQAWIESVQIGYLFRRNVFLFHMNRKGTPFRAYTLTHCWPKNWKAADLSTSASEIATEEITLVYDNMFMLANPMA